MFIRLNNQRIKSTSIGEFDVRGKSPCSERYIIDIKVSGKNRSFFFDTEKKMNETASYLDKVLDVKEI